METRFKGTSIALLVIFTVILGSFGYVRRAGDNPQST